MSATKGIIAFVAYAILYYALKDTPLYFNVSAGVRFALFIILPFRYWPYLIAGDMVASFTFAYPKLVAAPNVYTSRWLWPTVLLPVFGGIVPAAITRFFNLCRDLTTERMLFIFFAIAGMGAAISATVGLISVLTLSVGLKSLSTTGPAVFATFFAGTFLGNIMIAAPALAAWRRYQTKLLKFRVVLQCLRQDLSRQVCNLTFCVLGWSLPCIILAQISQGGQVTWIARIALFCPMILLAMSRGWWGACIGIIAMNFALSLTQGTFVREANLLLLMEFSALISAAVLAFGLSKTIQANATKMAIAAELKYRTLAKRSSEIPLAMRRHHATLIDRMFDEANRLLERNDLSKERAANIWWQTRKNLQVLRDAFHLPMLDSHGLRSALLGGPIAKALTMSGAAWHAKVSEKAPNLSRITQEMIYQVAHEGAFKLLGNGNPARMDLQLRVLSGARRFIVIRLVVTYSDKISSTQYQDQNFTCIGMDNFAILIEAFGGFFHDKKLSHRRSISALIHEIEHLPASIDRRVG